MITPQIVDYIKQAKSAGQSREQIVSSLLSAGWTKEQINQAFISVENNIPLPPSSPTNNSGQLLPKTYHQHMLCFFAKQLFRRSLQKEQYR